MREPLLLAVPKRSGPHSASKKGSPRCTSVTQPPAPTLSLLCAGRVFCSRMEGSQLGVLESWRYMHGSAMAVRTALRTTRGGPEVRFGLQAGCHSAERAPLHCTHNDYPAPVLPSCRRLCCPPPL